MVEITSDTFDGESQPQTPQVYKKKNVIAYLKTQKLAIVIVVVVLVGFGGYFGQQKYKTALTQSTTLGGQKVITTLSEMTKECQIVKIQNGDTVRQVVNVDCIKQAPPAGQAQPVAVPEPTPTPEPTPEPAVEPTNE